MVWLHGDIAVETVHGIVHASIAVHKGKGGFVAVVGTEATTSETWEEAVNELAELLKGVGKEHHQRELI